MDASLTVRVKPGQLGVLQFIHCTLVPNNNNNNPSIEVKECNDSLNVTVYRSICGKIHASLDSGSKFDIMDSIVDGKQYTVKENNGSGDGNNPNVVNNINTSNPGEKTESKYDKSNTIVCFKINLQNSTILGKVNVYSINASNTIFTDTVIARRRQEGCV